MDQPYQYQEYPKALYPSADQASAHEVATDSDSEAALRERGLKPLAEWWAEPAPAKAAPEKPAAPAPKSEPAPAKAASR